MALITRYLFNQLTGFFLAVTLALCLVVWLAQSLRFIDLIVNDNIPTPDFIYFVLLLMPYFLVTVLPLATFCSVLFIYNKLGSDRELIVLKAAGFSQLQLAKPGLMMIAGAVGLIYALNLYFLPVSYREFRELKAYFAQNLTPALLKEGKFNTVDRYTVYFRDKSQTGLMENIIIHDASNPDQSITFLASSGTVHKQDDSLRAVLYQVSRQSVDKQSGRLSIAYSDRYALDFGQAAGTTANRHRKPREFLVGELFNPDPARYSPRQRQEMRANAHYRIGSPLFTLALGLMALATVLSGEFSRHGQTKRLLTGIGAMAFIVFSQFIIKDWSENIPALIPLIYFWPAGVIVLSFIVLLLPTARTPRGQNINTPLSPEQGVTHGS